MITPSQPLEASLNRCPACGGQVFINPAGAVGDSPCPHCRWLLWFVTRSVDDVVVLTFLPGLLAGSESAGRVDEVLSAAGKPPRLVLNLSRLRVVSSLFLGMLVGLHKRVTEAQGAMRICGLEPFVLETLRTTKLDTLLAICDDEQTAVASCRNEATL